PSRHQRKLHSFPTRRSSDLITKTAGFITDEALQAIKKEVVDGLLTLEKGTGKGNDFLGWLDLPTSVGKDEITKIRKSAERLSAQDRKSTRLNSSHVKISYAV